jgi:hypothetical protein
MLLQLREDRGKARAAALAAFGAFLKACEAVDPIDDEIKAAGGTVPRRPKANEIQAVFSPVPRAIRTK